MKRARCVEVSVFAEFFVGCCYALEVCAHGFGLVFLEKLLSLIPNQRSNVWPQLTWFPLLWHKRNAPLILFQKNRGRHWMLSGAA